MTKKEEKQIIYIGDSIGSVLKKDTVFIGGIPAHVGKLIEENPELNLLFVDIEDMIEKKKRIKEKGTIEYLVNKNIKEAK